MRNAALFLLLALSVWAQPVVPRLDVVLLVEDSVLVCNIAHMTKLNTLLPGDRVAVMTYSKRAAVKLGFTDSLAAIHTAIRNLGGSQRGDTLPLWDAVASAVRQFSGSAEPGRKRVVVLLFSRQNKESVATPDSVHEALVKAGASLSAAAFGERVELKGPRAGGVWSEDARITGAPMLPALHSVREVVDATAGILLEAKWNFRAVVDTYR